MMKRSNPFPTFRRQSLGAIAVAIVKYFESVVRQALWPLIILYMFGSGADSFTKIVIYITLFAGSFSILAAIFRYYYFTFCVQDGKLNVKSGVMTTKNLSIPFPKIQRVEFEQNIVHRMLGIATVRIETAGAEEEEVEISALKIEEAELLRATLLEGRELQQLDANDSEHIHEDQLIFSLSLIDLIRAGLLRNHLRTAGLVFGFFVGMYFQFEDFLDLEEIYSTYLPNWYYSSNMWSGFVLFLPIGVILVILISLIRTVLQYFGFKMWRKHQGYQVSYGAFNRSTYSSLDKKVQFLFWRDNLLMRKLGMYSAAIFQAGSVALRRRQAIQIPFCYDEQIDRIKSDIFLEYSAPQDWSFATHPAFERLLLFRLGFLPVLGFLWIHWLNSWSYFDLIWIIVWMVLVVAWSRYYTRNLSLKMNDSYLSVEKGLLSFKRWVLEYPKLQGATLSSNPFEERRGLATVTLHSAAGDITFPYLLRAEAERIVNKVLYRIEYLRTDWM